MIRFIAILFGIGFIFAGTAGFIHEGALMGLFATGNLRNIVQIVSGVLAIMASTNYQSTKYYFLIFGIFYLLAAIIGFITGGNLFFMQVDMTDNFFHLAIGVVFLFLVYYFKKI